MSTSQAIQEDAMTHDRSEAARSRISRWIGRKPFWLPPVLGLLLAGPAVAALNLTWWTIDGGGRGGLVGGGLRCDGTIGQPDAGTLNGNPLTLAGGFWKGGRLAAGIEGDDAAGLPRDLSISPCAPNPFSGKTALRIDLPEAQVVRAQVYDQTGRLLRTLTDAVLPSGHHQIVWNGTDAGGRRLASGVYLVRVIAGSEIMRRSVVLIR
jgi:hypothetical protein